MPAQRFRWSDSWLLHAILQAAKHGPASLTSIIEAGDAINHALFTTAELNGGLARLLDGGLIEAEGSGFRPSSAALREYQSWAQLDIRQESEAAAKFLEAEDELPVESAAAPPWAPTREVVSDQRIAEAERSYFARIREK